MPDTFNGYHVWLGIPASEQPPNHYRLLGIAAFESDLDVIEHAADRQMAHVRTFQSGRHQALSQQILNELAAARLCLLSAPKKAAYDDELRLKLGAVHKAVPVGKAIPVAAAKAPPAAAVKPTARAPHTAVIDTDPLELDVSSQITNHEGTLSAPLGSSVTLRRPKRYRRSSTWQGPAVMGVVAGLAVIGLMLLYVFVKWAAQHDWSTIDTSLFEPPASAVEPRDVEQQTTDPPAPQPAPRSAEPAEPSR